MNAQKRMFSLRFCSRADQCERTKTEVFLSVFVQKRSSVNGSFDAMKTDTNKNGVVSSGGDRGGRGRLPPKATKIV